MIRSQTPLSQFSQETPSQDLLQGSNDLNKCEFRQPSENNTDKDGESQSILEEKKEESQYLEFLDKSDKCSVLSKKLKDLSGPQMKVFTMCYIPERNLLLVILKDKKRVNIYNTVNFKLFAVRTFSTEVHAISYCQPLDKILVGGAHNSIEIWNPITFKTEKRVCDEASDASSSIQNIKYLPELNIIFTTSKYVIFIYDTNLNLMCQFQPLRKNASWDYLASEIFVISNDKLLVTCFHCERRFFFLINLKTHVLKEYNEFFIPYLSSIERTGPNTFLALVHLNQRRPQAYWKLMQMTFDLKTEEFVFSKETVSSQSFRRFVRVENSRYFLAKYRTGSSGYGICLFLINEDKIEMIRMISESWSIWDKSCMMKDGFSMVQIDYKDEISIGNMKVQREKELIHDEGMNGEE